MFFGLTNISIIPPVLGDMDTWMVGLCSLLDVYLLLHVVPSRYLAEPHERHSLLLGPVHVAQLEWQVAMTEIQHYI